MSSTMTAIPALGFLAMLAVLTPESAEAQQRLVVPLSDPTRPATLEVNTMGGDVSVTAYDGNEILIVTSESDEGDSVFEPDSEFDIDVEVDFDDEDEQAERPSREGLRQIQNSGIGLTAEESANTVRVDMGWHSREDADLQISVPRRTSVHIAMHSGDDLAIAGVIGDHELMNARGDIAATDVGGSAVINTQNGDIYATFTEIASDKAMSFTSFNGDIDVALPATLSATLVISAGRGDVFTDFDFTLQPAQTVVETPAEGSNYRVRLESAMRAVVGGGGPEVRFQTFNGDVVVRRR